MSALTGIKSFQTANTSQSLSRKIHAAVSSSSLRPARIQATNTFWQKNNLCLDGRALLSNNFAKKTVSTNKNVIVLINGHFTNTIELRNNLILRTGTKQIPNTEAFLALYAYLEFGEDFCSLLEGAFSIVIYDERYDTLFLCSDRIGLKPLYYYLDEDFFAFSSDFKTLLKLDFVSPTLDLAGLSQLFSIGPARSYGSSLIKNTNKLTPASLLSFNFSTKKLAVKKYWELYQTQHTDTLEQTFEKTKFLLKSAVEKNIPRQMGGSNIGSMLSGGLDSTLVSQLLANKFGKLKTFSVDYTNNDKFFKQSDFQPDSDAYWIAQALKTIPGTHKDIVITPDELELQLKNAMLLRGFPGMADVDSSLLIFCDRIKRDVNVCFSGEGADELFGGYPWFYSDNTLAKGSFPWSPNIAFRQSFLQEDLSKKIFVKDYTQALISKSLTALPKRKKAFSESEKNEDAIRNLFFLNKEYFLTNLIERCEAMSDYSDLDIRIPFADHRLFQYIWNVPWSQKNYKNVEKSLLRGSFNGVISDEILWRKKSPYPKTYNPKYTRLIQTALQNQLSKKGNVISQIIDVSVLTRYLSNPDEISIPWYGQLLAGPQLLAYMLQLSYWLEEFKIKIKV